MEETKLRAILTERLLDLRVTQEKLGTKLGPRNLTHRRYENTVSNFIISYLERDDRELRGSV
jgi:hypothetical protein